MVTKICLICGKEFDTYLHRIKDGRGKFCSQQCYWKNLRGKPSGKKGKKSPQTSGKNNHQWRGGEYRAGSGYVFIYQVNHPATNKRNYVQEHRLVAEKCLKRYLTRKERIHHINGIKDDNRPENLYLFNNESKHQLFHNNHLKIKLVSNLVPISTR